MSLLLLTYFDYISLPFLRMFKNVIFFHHLVKCMRVIAHLSERLLVFQYLPQGSSSCLGYNPTFSQAQQAVAPILHPVKPDLGSSVFLTS